MCIKVSAETGAYDECPTVALRARMMLTNSGDFSRQRTIETCSGFQGDSV